MSATVTPERKRNGRNRRNTSTPLFALHANFFLPGILRTRLLFASPARLPLTVVRELLRPGPRATTHNTIIPVLRAQCAPQIFASAISVCTEICVLRALRVRSSRARADGISANMAFVCLSDLDLDLDLDLDSLSRPQCKTGEIGRCIHTLWKLHILFIHNNTRFPPWITDH